MLHDIKEVQDLLGVGFSQAAVGRFYGVSQSTLNNWLGAAGMARRTTRTYTNAHRKDGLSCVKIHESEG